MKYVEHNNFVVLRKNELSLLESGEYYPSWDGYDNQTNIISSAVNLEIPNTYVVSEYGKVIPGIDDTNRVLLNISDGVNCCVENAKIYSNGRLVLHGWADHYAQIVSAIVVLDENEWIAIVDYDETRTTMFTWNGAELIETKVTEIPKSEKEVTIVAPELVVEEDYYEEF